MGGGTPRAHTSHAPPRNHPRHPPPRHSRTPSPTFLRPSPSFLRRQEPATSQSPPHLPSSPIHPSPLLGGRLGGGWDAPSDYQRPSGRLHSPRRIHTPPSFPRPTRHSCAGRNHPTPPIPPNPATLTPEQECRTMPLSPQRRRPAPHPSFPRPLPSFLRRQEPNLANADQNLTDVDTRLTKVDKGCQKLTPSTPAHTPNPSKTQQIRTRAHHPATPSVNPPCQPLRHTPNNPEQIRTNLNKPERRQAPRPDRTAPRITPQHPEKNKPRTPSAPPARAVPACAGMTERGGRRA